MTKASTVETPVQPKTALALSDPRRLEAIGRLVAPLVRPDADAPLIALFKRTSAEAEAAGLTETDIDAELTAYNAVRRA